MGKMCRKRFVIALIMIVGIVLTLSNRVDAGEDADIESFLLNWSGLVDKLGMSQSKDDLYFLDNSYCDLAGLRISWEENNMWCNNEGNAGVSAFGIRLGDTKAEAYKKADLVCKRMNAFFMDDILAVRVGGRDFYLTLEFKDEMVDSWWFSNLIEGDWSYVYEDVLIVQEKYGKLISDSWKKDYIRYIFDKGMDYNGDWKYYLINIDGDDIPEIYLKGNSYAQGDRVATIKNKKVDEVFFADCGGNYINKKNIICDSGGHMDVYYDIIYKIKDGKFVILAKGNYGASDNSNVILDQNGEPIYQYFWNNKEVSKKEYKNKLNDMIDMKKTRQAFGGEGLSTSEVIEKLICDYE